MTIDRAAYFAARREGYSPTIAAYVARPAVLDLDFVWHYQADGEWADFVYDGRTYRAQVGDPAIAEGTCTSCSELVRDAEDHDDTMAWMTPDEYERLEHRFVTVTLLDADGDETGWSTSLHGVCSDTSTPTLRRLDDRFVAETVLDLRYEVDAYRERAAELAARKRAAELAATREAYMAAVAACDAA